MINATYLGHAALLSSGRRSKAGARSSASRSMALCHCASEQTSMRGGEMTSGSWSGSCLRLRGGGRRGGQALNPRCHKWGSELDFLTDFRVARELTRESDGSVPLGDLSLPR